MCSSDLPRIADEIIMNAISACSEDPRFSPVEEDELDDLDINVDVLEKPESIESPADLDPQLYGVIVSRGMRRGLLLPRLEGVDTPDQQIAISKRKAGIGRFETVNLQRFEVTRHEVENDG